MTHRADHIAKLFVKRLKGELSPSESAELVEWTAQSESHQDAFDDLTNPERIAAILHGRSLMDTSDMLEKLDERFPGINKVVSSTAGVVPVHRVHFLKRSWFRY